MFDLDKHLGVHAQALVVRERRTELIANNLANADTPGFKAQDIDFRQALAQAAGKAQSGSGALGLTITTQGHQGGAATQGSADGIDGLRGLLRYRSPFAPSLDGNTVDVQVEQAAFAENAVRYQATLSFLSSRFRGLMTAITGQ